MSWSFQQDFADKALNGDQSSPYMPDQGQLTPKVAGSVSCRCMCVFDGFSAETAGLAVALDRTAGWDRDAGFT